MDIHILTITRDNWDDFVSAYRSREGADKALKEYVKKSFTAELDEPCPDEITDDVVLDYFERAEEKHSIKKTFLND